MNKKWNIIAADIFALGISLVCVIVISTATSPIGLGAFIGGYAVLFFGIFIIINTGKSRNGRIPKNTEPLSQKELEKGWEMNPMEEDWN